MAIELSNRYPDRNEFNQMLELFVKKTNSEKDDIARRFILHNLPTITQGLIMNKPFAELDFPLGLDLDTFLSGKPYDIVDAIPILLASNEEPKGEIEAPTWREQLSAWAEWVYKQDIHQMICETYESFTDAIYNPDEFFSNYSINERTHRVLKEYKDGNFP